MMAKIDDETLRLIHSGTETFLCSYKTLREFPTSPRTKPFVEFGHHLARKCVTMSDMFRAAEALRRAEKRLEKAAENGKSDDVLEALAEVVGECRNTYRKMISKWEKAEAKLDAF